MNDPFCRGRAALVNSPGFVAAAGLALSLSSARALRAQEATATLEVRGATGDRVVLEAPGLSREAVPTGEGSVAFAHLPPGTYRLEAGPGCPDSVELTSGERQVLECGEEGGRPRRSSGFEAKTEWGAATLAREPRPADPWSVLRDVPGVVVDRVNVGGSESEQQSLLVSRGDPGLGASWSFDGVDLTDPAALGTTLAYPDMDALQALSARTSTGDVRVRTPGVQVSLAFRAPENRLSGGAHLRGSWAGLQSNNLPEELRGRPFFRNSTETVSEIGAELGGPLGGRGWLWASAFRNALDQSTFTEHQESLRTSGLMTKGRWRARGGTLTGRGLFGDKRHDERDPGLSTAPEARWRQTGPTWMVGLEDQRRAFGLSMLSHLSWVNGGFKLQPQGGSEASALDDFRGVLQRSYTSFETDRRRLRGGLELSGTSRALGFHHSLVGGLAFSHATVETRQGWPGNSVQAVERRGVFFQAFRLTGFAVPYRDAASRATVNGFAAYLGDEVPFSRFTLALGLRLERLQGHSGSSAVDANPLFPELLPAARYDGDGAGVTWVDLLPRIGFAADLGRAGTARVAYAAYAAPLGAAEVGFDDPLRDFASVTYYWKDDDTDGVVGRNELDLLRGRVGASGFDPSRPDVVESPHAIDPELRAPRTHEALASWDGGWKGARFSLRAAWRRLQHGLWRPLRGLTLVDYAARGQVDGTLKGEAYAVTYFAPASTSQLVPGNGRILTNRQGYAQDAFVAEADARGRLGESFDWRLHGAFMDARERFFDREQSVQDPTPLDTDPLVDGGQVVIRPGGLGRGDLFVGAHFAGGASARVRLPAGLEAAGVVHMREGFPIPYYEVASTGDPTAGSKNVLISGRLDRYRLPGLVVLDLRLARAFPVGRGHVRVSLDVWNALNAGTTLQVARDVDLPAFDRPREIVRPRLLRLGLDWRF